MSATTPIESCFPQCTLPVVVISINWHSTLKINIIRKCLNCNRYAHSLSTSRTSWAAWIQAAYLYSNWSSSKVHVKPNITQKWPKMVKMVCTVFTTSKMRFVLEFQSTRSLRRMDRIIMANATMHLNFHVVLAWSVGRLNVPRDHMRGITTWPWLNTNYWHCWVAFLGCGSSVCLLSLLAQSIGEASRGKMNVSSTGSGLGLQHSTLLLRPSIY